MIRSEVGTLKIFNVMPCSVRHFTAMVHFIWKLKTAHQLTVVLPKVTYCTPSVGCESRTSLVSNYIYFADAPKVTGENITYVTLSCCFAGIYWPVGVVIVKSNVFFKFRVSTVVYRDRVLEILDITFADILSTVKSPVSDDFLTSSPL